MLRQQHLLPELAQPFGHVVQVDDAVVDGLLVGIVLGNAQSLRDRLQALVQVPQLQPRVGPAQNAVIDLVAAGALAYPLLEQVAQVFVKIPSQEVRALHWLALMGTDYSLEVAGLEGVVVGCDALDQLLQFLGVGPHTVVLQVELDLLDGLGEHELVLAQGPGDIVAVVDETLVYLDYLFEVQLLEVDVEPPDKEIHQVALLQFGGPHAPQVL